MRRQLDVKFHDSPQLLRAVEDAASDTFVLGSKVAWIRLFEDDPRWPKLKELLNGQTTSISSGLQFKASELARSDFLTISARGAGTGYPYPTDPEGYREATYNAAGGCAVCGAGYVQTSPFRVTPNPKLKSKQAFQLNWVNDELFCTAEFYATVFKPLGIGSEFVLQPKGAVIDHVVQLKLTDVSTFASTEKLAGEVCDVCGKTKYFLRQEDYLPTPVGATAPIFRSREYFGAGGRSAYNLMFVTGELYQTLVNVAPRDFAFFPCV